MNYSKVFKTVLFLLLALMLTGSAQAQKPDKLTGMTLDVSTLTLNPGDSYTFTPQFTTQKVSGYTPVGLQIFSSDERVIKPGEELNSITAVGGGEAVLQLYSADYEFAASCSVTVTGEAVSVAKKGDIWAGPASDELGKITDPALKTFYEMLDRPEMFDSAASLAQSRRFKTLVRVTPGRAESLAEAMRKIGMDPVFAFDLINTISVTGTPEQYLILLRSENVLLIEEDEIHETEDMLEGQAETISHFSAAYGMGLDGKGTAIAFLDSGIFPSHEQFTGKKDSSIIYQACFSSNDPSKGTVPACHNGQSEDRTSAEIGPQIHNLKEFTHGTHVTAIASGKDGVAPKSDIIAVNVFSEFAETCQDSSGKIMTCYSGGTYTSDQIRGFQYILKLLNDSNQISVNGDSIQLAAVNMSIGSGRFTNICADDKREPYIRELLDRGVITTASSGNSGWDGSITSPACAPSAIAVGALHDSGDPQVAYYSNHSKLVDILAPGTRILSAAGNTNQYEVWSGTSMAAPMVSGSAALIRQMLPDLNGQALKTLLTEMSPQSAARAKIEIPVLDLDAIRSTSPYLSSGPDMKVYGGDKMLQIDFKALPFNTKCAVNVYIAEGETKFVKGQLVKSFDGKNLKSAKVKGLSNDTPYIIEASCSVTLMKKTYDVPSVTAYGMPMTQGKGFTVEKSSSSSARLSWTAQNGALLYAEYGPADDSKPYFAEGDQDCILKDLPAGEPVYLDMYKAVKKGGKLFLSLPTAKQYVSVGDPILVNALPGAGKIWLEFEAEKDLSSREIQIWTAESSGTGDLRLISKQKALTVDNKKTPTDVILTGLKNDMTYAVCYRNVVKLGKESFYGEWRTAGPFTPNADSFERISSVTLTSGSRTAELTFSKDLSVDGYLFELKPIIPNQTKITYDVKADKAQGSYTFKDIVNGVVYKLRIGKYKQKNYSEYYPYTGGNLTRTVFDNAWEGLVFIPLPEAEYEVTPKYSNRPLTISVQKAYTADGFTAVIINGDPGGKSCIKSVPWDEGDRTELRLSVEDTARTVIVMLYKDYEGARYYGPASWNGDIANSQFIFDYGPKSAGDFDLFSEPEFASSPQIAGQLIVPEFNTEEKAVSLPDEEMIIPTEETGKSEAVPDLGTAAKKKEDKSGVTFFRVGK